MPVPLPVDLLEKINHREADSFAYHADCRLPFGRLEPVLVWARCECVKEWRWEIVSMATDIAPGHYRFYFDDEGDAVAFSLQWS